MHASIDSTPGPSGHRGGPSPAARGAASAFSAGWDAASAAPAWLRFFLAACFAINLVFVLKYGSRLGVSLAPLAAGYAAFFLVTTLAGVRAGRFAARRARTGPWLAGCVALYLLLALPVYLRLDPYALQADRWSALSGFLSALFEGRFPYAASTHLGHPISGFPALFLLALPFHLAGDVGFLQFAALIAFAVLLRVRAPAGSGRPVFLLVFLLAMPVFQYQVFARSDLFANLVAAGWLLHLGLPRGADPDPARGARLWIFALAWGLMLATRGVLVIPFLLAASGLLRRRGMAAAGAFFVLAGATALATFAPFYLWDPALFLRHNPFDVQSGYVPRWLLAAALAAAGALGWSHRAAPRPFLHAGWVLFVVVLACAALAVARLGWAEVLWSHGFDVSYFCMGLPFLLIAAGEPVPHRTPPRLS